VEAPAAGFRRTSRRRNGAFLTIRPRLLPVSSISIYVSIGTSDHVLRYWPLDAGDGVGPTLTYIFNSFTEVGGEFLVIHEPPEYYIVTSVAMKSLHSGRVNRFRCSHCCATIRVREYLINGLF